MGFRQHAQGNNPSARLDARDPLVVTYYAHPPCASSTAKEEIVCRRSDGVLEKTFLNSEHKYLYRLLAFPLLFPNGDAPRPPTGSRQQMYTYLGAELRCIRQHHFFSFKKSLKHSTLYTHIIAIPCYCSRSSSTTCTYASWITFKHTNNYSIVTAAGARVDAG